MHLPNDYARCAGTHRAECQDCLRKTSPSNSERQAWIGVWVLPEPCESRIANEMPKVPKRRKEPSAGKQTG